jgi:hypothetical protein
MRGNHPYLFLLLALIHSDVSLCDTDEGNDVTLLVAASTIKTKNLRLASRHYQQQQQQQQQHQQSAMLNMTLCVDECRNDCKSYITPLSRCYNPQTLFPNDPSWSPNDVSDTVICQTLTRRIYSKSSNGTCRRHDDDDDDDQFVIPLNECVGPFGRPRPWGTFRLVPNHGNDDDPTATTTTTRFVGSEEIC